MTRKTIIIFCGDTANNASSSSNYERYEDTLAFSCTLAEKIINNLQPVEFFCGGFAFLTKQTDEKIKIKLNDLVDAALENLKKYSFDLIAELSYFSYYRLKNRQDLIDLQKKMNSAAADIFIIGHGHPNIEQGTKIQLILSDKSSEELRYFTFDTKNHPKDIPLSSIIAKGSMLKIIACYGSNFVIEKKRFLLGEKEIECYSPVPKDEPMQINSAILEDANLGLPLLSLATTETSFASFYEDSDDDLVGIDATLPTFAC